MAWIPQRKGNAMTNGGDHGSIVKGKEKKETKETKGKAEGTQKKSGTKGKGGK